MTTSIIENALKILKNGGIVAIPTETVYGLGADASNPQGLSKVFKAKGRPESHPLIVHIADINMINNVAIDMPDYAKLLAQSFWPGPMTLILQKHPDIPYMVTGGQDTVGVRVPNHPITLALLTHFKHGIAAPSANPFGKTSPTTAEHVRKNLGNTVDLIIDGGPCKRGIESTIIDCTKEKPYILRHGAITEQEVSKALAKEGFALDRDEKSKNLTPLKVPGNLASHYAPESTLIIVPTSQLIEKVKKLLQASNQLVVISYSNFHFTAKGIIWFSMPTSPIDYAHLFYAQLHYADSLKPNFIVVEEPPRNDEWHAIHDRLLKASHKES